MEVAFEKVTAVQDIYGLLNDFEVIFPHLREKISSFKEYAEKLSQNAEVVKGLIDGKLCGILVYYQNDLINHTAYVSLIGVFEEFRGKKVADLLLEFCESSAKQAGMTKLKLEVDDDNARAIAFYRKKGFIEVAKGKESAYMQKNII